MIRRAPSLAKRLGIATAGCLSAVVLGVCVCSGTLSLVGRGVNNVPNRAEAPIRKQLAENVQANADQRGKALDGPVEFETKIVDDMPPHVVYVDVRIPQRVTERQLEEIAHQIEKRLKKRYEGVFIFYLLPGMQSGSGAWATTHFEGHLLINIIGTTIEAESALLAIARQIDQSVDYIGQWKDSNTTGPHRIIRVYRSGAKTLLESIASDDRSLTEIVLFNAGGRVRFVEKTRLQKYVQKRNDPEFYEIEPDGCLTLNGLDRGFYSRFAPVSFDGKPNEPAARIPSPDDVSNLSEIRNIGLADPKNRTGLIQHSDPEKWATGQLRQAKLLHQAGRTNSAKRYLERIFEECPDTAAALEAKQLFKTW